VGKKSSLGLVFVLGLLAGGVGARADVSDTFSVDGAGWTHIGDNTNPPAYNVTGGNPGGYISIADPATGSDDYFVAPSKYLGNDSAYAGGTMSWDILLSTNANTFDYDLILVGNGEELDYAYPLANLPTAGSWITTTVTLAPGDPNWRVNEIFGDDPTMADFANVLSNLSELHILSDYAFGPETDGLDNVVLHASAATPEPASLGLLGIGAALFLVFRRRD
jgi:hypothetical protein